MTQKMKKLIIVFALVLTTSMVSFAQDSKFMAGGGLSYATKIENIGLNIKGLYLIDETWEAAGGFTYFFKKNYTTWSALDFDGHYILSNTDGMSLYALAGLNFTFFKFEMDNALGGLSGLGDMGDEYGDYNNYANALTSSAEITGSDVGVNIGIGGRMPLSDKLFLTGEIKYTLGGANYLNAGVGILYSF